MRWIFILIAILALPVWAADTGTASNLHAFTPPPGDISIDFLHQIFGTAADGIGAGGSTVIGEMMRVFNNAVLFLAMFFVMYTTIMGTINSAHDGVILGKKMSEIWVPIRTVGGSAMLLPLASGFSLIQMGVLWLAMQGVGVADATWQAAMSQFATNGTLGRVSVPDSRPLAANILRSEVCAAAMNKQFTDSGRATRITLMMPQPQQLPNGDLVTTWSWGSPEFINPAVCGALAWQQSSQSALTADVTRAAALPILQAQGIAVAQMIAELQPTAQMIVAFQHPAPGALDIAAKHYEDAIAVAAKAAVDASPDVARQAFISKAETGGWILAGSFFNDMIRLNDSIQAAANMAPVLKPISIDSLEVQETLITYRDAMSFTDEYLKNRSAAPRNAYEESVQDAKAIRSSDDVWRLLSVPAMQSMDAITQRIAGANTSPLMQLRAIGNDIIGAGVVIKAAMFTLAGFAGSRAADLTIGNVFNVADALKTISGTVEWGSSMLWGIGAVLAFYLPIVPMIWWLTGVIRWLASVAEVVLASPLMAAMHMHPAGGDDVVGRAGPGYFLLLATVMQPVLLVIGFVLAALMTYPAGQLVNMMFIGIVSGATAGSFVGLISLIAWCALYVVMMVLAMHTCFGLISAVPDNVMRYVGSQAGAQGIGTQQAEKGFSGLESGAAGAGAAAARPKGGDMQLGKGDKPKPGGEPKGGNGFTNADHMGH